MLEHITPVILTHNEEQNIARTMSKLFWAKDIVVVDSGSTDATLDMLTEFPNVRIFNRRFDTHANQWRYAIEETQIATDWILRLDADYQLSDALVSEVARLDPNTAVSAYRIGFDYAIFRTSFCHRSILPIPSCCVGIVFWCGTKGIRRRGT